MIIQEDNGTTLKLNIKENNLTVDLSGATVNVKIKAGNRTFYKTATINSSGECEVTLNSGDLVDAGKYDVQITVVYIDNKTFSSDIQSFTVGSKL
jgi:5-hydroxyisourate hydrolase-like protein (transthyretin family)